MAEASKKTVLIVDDDISVSEYLDVAIKSAGHSTILAYDGESALEKFKQHKPDLVILDALIPKVDGFEVCYQIKKNLHGRTVPVVMMTGIYTKRSYRQQALNVSGAIEYIVKPFGISEIWRVLRDHLGSGPPPGQAIPKETEITEQARAEQDVQSGLQAFFQKGEMALGHGTPITQSPLAVTLRDLYMGHKTGLLFLRSDKWTSIFYLDLGHIVFVRSNDLDLRLDRVLVKMRKITEEQYEKAQELFKSHRGRRRMGEILIGLGILHKEDLEEALRFQLQLLVARAFQWKDGVAHFVEGDLPNREDILLKVDTRTIIFMGVKNMRDPEMIRRHLPDPNTVLCQARGAEGAAEKIGLTAFERQILSVVDGTKTLRQVRSMGQLANVDIDALLFAFLCTGLIQEDRVNTGLLQGKRESGDGEEAPPRVRAFKGDLALKPMPQLLHALYRSRKTGILTVQAAGVRKWLQVERGEVIFAGSDDPDDRIGRVLVRANLISEDDLEKALGETAHKAGKRIGRVLVDGGHITLEELYWAVVFQVQRIVLSLFGWSDGSYLFREGPLPTRETIILELNTPNLVLEGVRSMPDDCLGKWLPSAGSQILRVTGAEDLSRQVGLSASESIILEAIRPNMTFQELLDAGLGAEEVVRRAVYAFSSIGLLQVSLPEGGEAMAQDLEREDLVAATAGAPPSTASVRPGPRPTPPSNPPIPFPAKGTAPPQPEPHPKVPRFLYDEILEERRDLEDQILHLFSENCEMELRLRQAKEKLRDVLQGPADQKAKDEAVQELLGLLGDLEPPKPS